MQHLIKNITYIRFLDQLLCKELMNYFMTNANDIYSLQIMSKR